MNTLVFGALATGLVGCVFFIISYHIRTNGACWRHEIGLWLMLSRIDLGAIFATLLFNRLWGDWFGRQQLIIALVVPLAIQTFWPIRLLWSAYATTTIQEHVTKDGEKKADAYDSRT